MRRFHIAFALGILIIFGLLLLPRPVKMGKNGEFRETTPQQAGQVAPSITPHEPRREESPSPPEISEIAPNAKILREELRTQPHAPPPSLLKFSDQLSERMDQTIADPERSEILLGELGDCVGNRDFTASVQVICLNNAAKIAEAHPSLKPRFDEIHRTAPEAALQIYEALKE